jgi:hypothetical protein
MNTMRSVLEKADLALADISGTNGILQTAFARQFMRLLVKNSKILEMATVTPLRAPKQLINKIRFNSRVLRAGQEAVALVAADRSKPDLTNVEHDAALFKAEVRISNETLEDNIEGDGIRNTIMTVLSEALSRDMEEVVVQGDTGSGDAFLASFDGLLELVSTHVVNVGTVSINKGVWRDMMKSMPNEWLRNKGALRFLTSVNAEIDYRDSLADRMTIGGDRALAGLGENTAPVGYSGIPVVDIPMFPENLGGGTNTTDAILTDPKNIDVGIWRQFRIETDKLIREGQLLIVVTTRFDVVVQEELATVKATNIKVGA